jgi:hypothetical protein
MHQVRTPGSHFFSIQLQFEKQNDRTNFLKVLYFM